MIAINRQSIITLSNAAYQLEDYSQARHIMIAWLKKYPNDLWLRYRLAIVLYKMGEYDSAIRLCELIVNEDPEFVEVWGLLAILYPELSEDRKNAERHAFRLKAKESDRNKKKGLFARIRKSPETESLIVEDDFDCLTAIDNAKAMLNDPDDESNYRILGIYHKRWPKAIQFKLVLGHILNRLGRVNEGMQILQGTVESDLIGQVSKRIWGDSNPYASLWTDLDKLEYDGETLNLSNEVIRLAGLSNVLPLNPDEEPLENEEMSPEETLSEDSPDIDIEDQFEEEIEPQPHEEIREALPGYENNKRKFLFRKGPQSSSDHQPIGEYVYKLAEDDADNRIPVYVVMSTISGLSRKYGDNNKAFVDSAMKSVADAVTRRSGWNARVFYPDELLSVPASGITPEMIHQQLLKYDESLRSENKRIGALLIVGGADVVPYFTLPNPANDDDLAVPSDAPYASTSITNCFEMLWMVGRIPGDDSKDTGLLLKQLRDITQYHLSQADSVKSVGKKQGGNSEYKSYRKSYKTFGYTCASWQVPSTLIYKTISDISSLMISPSTTSSNLETSRLDRCDLAYFNLHGIKGLPNWYGHKKPDDTTSSPRVPVALEIRNLASIEQTPKIIFTESCYGAESKGRNESNAICLHCLGKTTRVFIGSSTIAYGALGEKLTGADLLAYLFWKHLATGVTAGEAFRRAKKSISVETESQNGGLEPDVQKTLLSFLFYGDPLYTNDDAADITDMMQRPKSVREYELLTEVSNDDTYIKEEYSSEIYEKVRAQYNLEPLSAVSSRCDVHKVMKKVNTGNRVQHSVPGHESYVITYVKEERIGTIRMKYTIRVTLRDDGVIQKITFSR